MNFSSIFFKAARVSRDLSAVGSGNPKRMVRRVKNKVVGGALARSLLRRLWR